MFSVRCQTPSADAEEIHPKWWWDGGRDGCGRREEQREKSAGFFSRVTFLSVPMSETVKARPWCATSGRDRGDDGPRDGRVTELRLATMTAHHATGRSTPNRTDQRKQTLFSKHITPPQPSSVCPGVSGDWLSESNHSALIPLTQARLISSHSPVWWGDFRGQTRSEPCIPFPWSSALACTRPQSPAVFAPRSPCLWTTS